MPIEKNHPLLMRQVSNGFEAAAAEYRGHGTEDSKTMVFQTFEELVAWLAKHFSHRCIAVKTDKAPAAE